MQYLGVQLVELAWRGDIRGIRSLIHNNRPNAVSNINHRSFGWSALTVSIYKNLRHLLDVLLECGADFITAQPKDLTVLNIACTRGNTLLVKQLLDSGVDVNQTSTLRAGYTALMAACSGGHADIVRILIDEGADISAIGEHGKTPLFYAALSGDYISAQLLIEAGADVHAMDSIGQCVLLKMMSHIDAPMVVQLLIDNGADVEAADKDGNTVLLTASIYRSRRVIQKLLQVGADTSAVNRDGRMPYDIVLERGDEEIIKLFPRSSSGSFSNSVNVSREVSATSSSSPEEVDTLDYENSGCTIM